MWVDWFIFGVGIALGYMVKHLIDRVACKSCSDAIRYREDVVRQKGVAI